MKSSILAKFLTFILIVCLIGMLPVKIALAESSFMYGDVDDNETVNVADAILVLRHIVGLQTIEGYKWYAADVNADGKVDVGDAILILRYIVGLEDLFPAQKKLNEVVAAVELAETTLDPDDISDARELVDALPDIPPKVDLKDRLDAIDATGAATAAVEAAEAAAGELAGDGTDIQENIDTAQDLYIAAATMVENLPEGEVKGELEDRLSAVQDIINAAQKAYDDRQAANAVIALIAGLPEGENLTLGDKEAVEAARSAYDALTPEQKVLVNNLGDLVVAEETIIALEAATAAVERAELSMKRDDADAAYALVNALPDGLAKASLLHRLEIIFTELDKKTAIANAINAIAALPSPAEINLDHKDDVLAARVLVDIAVDDHGAIDADIINLGKLEAAEARISLLETEYTLIYIAGSNGSVEGMAIQVVLYGEDGASVTAVPDEGYYFVEWSDGISTATRTDINVTADLEVTANFALTPTYSDYNMILVGPDEVEIDSYCELNLGIWAEEPHGNSSYQATYEYSVSGGECSLYRGIELFSILEWFELYPDYDNRDQPISLMFIPREAATYEITVILRTAEGIELATASHLIKTGTKITGVADLGDITVDLGTPLGSLGLPEQVEVTLTDGSVYDVGVNWDTGTPPYNGNEPGTYTFTGILLPSAGMINPDNLVAHVDVIAVLVAEDYKYMVSLYTETEEVSAGDEFEVDINITSEDYDVFHGATIEITYDNSRVQYKDATALPDGFSIYSVTDGAATTLTILGASGGQGYPIANNVFLLATLVFEVRTDIISGPITIAIADDPIVNQEDDVQSTIAAKGGDISINLLN